MAKRVKRRVSLFGASAAKEKKKLKSRIAILLDEEKITEAYPLLIEAVEKYPKEEVFWDMFAFVGSELGDLATMQRAFAKLTYFQPTDPDNWYNLALVYAIGGYSGLALRIFNEFVRRFPHDSRKQKALDAMKAAETDVEGMLEAYGLPKNEESMKLAAEHDKVQLYLHQGDLERSIKTADELIKKAPDLIAPYNNLSLVYFMKGEVKNAIETAGIVLEKQPENFHALSNSVRFLVFLGKREEARELADRLNRTKSQFGDIYLKKIEAFAFLGDDESVTAVYREVEKKKIELKDEGYCKSLAAFSFYQLGNEKKAKKLWREASDLDYEDAEDNLAELENPVYDRDVYALSLRYWLPKAYFDELLDMTNTIADREDDDESVKDLVSGFLDNNEYFIKNFPIILERGDFIARDFVIKLTEWSENPRSLEILREFALGQSGSDEIRNQAVMVLSKLKVLPKKIRFWSKGKWTEVYPLDLKITTEPIAEKLFPMKTGAKKFLGRGVAARFNGDFELARKHFEKALEIQPDHPMLIYNVIAIRLNLGEKIDHLKEFRELHSRFPKYVFGAMTVGLLEIEEGNLEKAKEIAEAFVDREEWHVDEFKLWGEFQVEFCIARDLFDGARSWLEMLRAGSRDYWDEFDESEFEKMEKRIEIGELKSKLWKGFDKLKEKRKKKNRN